MLLMGPSRQLADSSIDLVDGIVVGSRSLHVRLLSYVVERDRRLVPGGVRRLPTRTGSGAKS